MRIITGPTVQLGLDLQYPSLRHIGDSLKFVGIHWREPPGIPVLRPLTYWPPSPCTHLSYARTTTGPPPRTGAVSRRRACPPADWMPAGKGGTSTLPTFTAFRSTSEPPSSTPTASPHLRRRHSPWPPHQHRKTNFEVAARQAACAAPGPDPPDWSRWNTLGTSGTGSSRTASRLACRTLAVWKYRRVPSLSGLLLPPRASPRIGCPQLHRTAATIRRQGSFTPAR